MFYFLYLFEEGLQDVPLVDRPAAITKKVNILKKLPEGAKINDFLPREITADGKGTGEYENEDFFFVDELDGKQNPVYMPQSLLAFLPHSKARTVDFRSAIPVSGSQIVATNSELVEYEKMQRATFRGYRDLEKKKELEAREKGEWKQEEFAEIEKNEFNKVIGDKNVRIDKLNSEIAKIQAEPFVKWMLREIDKQRKINGERTVVVGVYGQAGAGKTTFTDILVERLRKEMSLDERKANAQVEFIGADSYLKPGDMRYEKIAGGKRYTWIKSRPYETHFFSRNIQDILSGKVAQINNDEHKLDDGKKTRDVSGKHLKVLVMDLTAFGFSPDMQDAIQIVVPVIFQNDKVRLNRRYERDSIPTEETPKSRAISKKQIRADVFEKAMMEGISYMLPMIKDIAERRGSVPVWVPDTNQLVRLDRSEVRSEMHSGEVAQRSDMRNNPVLETLARGAKAAGLGVMGISSEAVKAVTGAQRSEMRNAPIRDNVYKKAPGTEDVSSDEDKFLTALYQNLMENGRERIVDLPDDVKKMLMSVFKVSPESAELLKSRKREPTTFRGDLPYYLEGGKIRFAIDDLSNSVIANLAGQREFAKPMLEGEATFGKLNLSVYPRLLRHDNPMGLAAFLKTDYLVNVEDYFKLKVDFREYMFSRDWTLLNAVKDRGDQWLYADSLGAFFVKKLKEIPGIVEPYYLIHIPSKLWEEIMVMKNSAEFLSQIVVHELIESLATPPDRMSAHRLAGYYEPFFSSEEARKIGVSDINLWMLRNGSDGYLQMLANRYDPDTDPSLGAIQDALNEEAERRNKTRPKDQYLLLDYNKKLEIGTYVHQGARPMFAQKSPGTLPVSDEEMLLKFLSPYPAGSNPDLLPEVPEEVRSWIEKNRFGEKLYEPLVSKNGKFIFKFALDDVKDASGTRLRFYPREGVLGPGVVFFVEVQGDTAYVHLPKLLWEDKKDDKYYLSQILVMAYIQNYLPSVKGITRSSAAGLSALHFGDDAARHMGINNVDLDVLEYAAKTKDMPYFLHLLGSYRSSRDPLGNFKRAVEVNLNRVIGSEGLDKFSKAERAKEEKARERLIAKSILNGRDLVFYVLYLFEEGLQGTPKVERPAKITERINALVSLNPKIGDFLPKKQADGTYKNEEFFFVDEKIGGTPAYMPQSLRTYLNFRNEETIDFSGAISAAMNLTIRMKSDQVQSDRGELPKMRGDRDLAKQRETEAKLIPGSEDAAIYGARKNVFNEMITSKLKRINDLNSDIASIQAEPFVKWMLVEIDKKIKFAGQKTVLVGVYGQAGAGKTTFTDILVKRLSSYLSSTGDASAQVGYIGGDSFLKPNELRYLKEGGNRYTMNKNRPYETHVMREKIKGLANGKKIKVKVDTHKVIKGEEDKGNVEGATERERILAERGSSERDRNREVDGQHLKVIVVDLTAYSLTPDMLDLFDIVVPLIFQNDKVRLDRRYQRDTIPKEEWGDSRADSFEQTGADFFQKQMEEGISYMLPMIKDLAERRGSVPVWAPDSNELLIVRPPEQEKQVLPLGHRSEMREVAAPSTERPFELSKTGRDGVPHSVAEGPLSVV
ncbi:MAG: hypothetical protein PHV97_04535, partial [Candidatus Omnitrophica bacterium]|nr:hypothetical protein [Candidatus Omnitrophota bacterium]